MKNHCTFTVLAILLAWANSFAQSPTSFTKITTGEIVTNAGIAWGAAWGDFDNDGFIDLVVGNEGADFLYRNNRDGTFTPITSSPVVTNDFDCGGGVAFADYDNDGHLDLIVTGCSGPPNKLFRNNGDGTFTRLLQADIGDLDDPGFIQQSGAAWGDYDNDGDQDIFVTQGGALSLLNDALYRNNGDGTFTKMTSDLVGPLVNDLQPGADCAWADYDNDGWLDLYVANPGLSNSGGETGRENLLYHNNGDGSFTQITTGSLVSDVASSNSGIWGDYDNDGFMDLFVANGGYPGPQADSLYRNNGNTNSWLKLKLIGTASNRSAIGAKIRVRATIKGKTTWQMREISGGDGFLSQNDMRPNFGLGAATSAETVRIEWPSGIVQELHNVLANQILTVTESATLERHLSQANGLVELKIKSWKGFVYGIEASGDLKTWTRVTTLTNETGILSFADPLAATVPNRFYRTVAP